jgi:LCP family protein required for cell wall assembly
MRNPRNRTKMAKPRRQMDRLTVGLLIAFGVLAIATAVVAFFVARNLFSSWTMTDLPGLPDVSDQSSEMPETLPGGTPVSAPLQSASGPTPVPWDGASRITVLVMGLDYRDWEAGEVPRTDTMIMLTVDPLTKTAGMLSIPRDMWVNIPGFDYGKINTAYYLGETYKLPGGGPALAMQTVENFLGVPIDYYAQIDFMAFVKFIDEIGGLDINVMDEIRVARIGSDEESYVLHEGVQNLDGMETLGYARSRYTGGGDFDRAERQQQVIMAIREQIVTFDMLPTLIAKSPILYQELSSGIRTNLSLQQVIQLAMLGTQINAKQIKQIVIPPDVVYESVSPDGLSILIPIPDEIRALRDKVFAVSSPASPSTANVDPAELVKMEQARVTVVNGTQTGGLATSTSEYLRAQGINVVSESTADRVYETTTIIIYNGKPYTINYLAQTMGVPTSQIFNSYNPDAPSDIDVILGNNWASSNPMPQ